MGFRNSNLAGGWNGPQRALQGVLGACLFFVAGCAGLSLGNVEQAVKDLESAAQAVESAAEILYADPNLTDAYEDLQTAWRDVQAARHALLGLDAPDESCASRCFHECKYDPFVCLQACPSGCEPHCCGCDSPDGTPGCGNCPKCNNPPCDGSQCPPPEPGAPVSADDTCGAGDLVEKSQEAIPDAVGEDAEHRCLDCARKCGPWAFDHCIARAAAGEHPICPPDCSP